MKGKGKEGFPRTNVLYSTNSARHHQASSPARDFLYSRSYGTVPITDGMGRQTIGQGRKGKGPAIGNKSTILPDEVMRGACPNQIRLAAKHQCTPYPMPTPDCLRNHTTYCTTRTTVLNPYYPNPNPNPNH